MEVFIEGEKVIGDFEKRALPIDGLMQIDLIFSVGCIAA